MGSETIPTPEMGFGAGDPIPVPLEEFDPIVIPINPGIDFSSLSCFPNILLEGLEPIPDEGGSIEIPFTVGNELVEARKIVIGKGYWNMTIINNLPFSITSILFTMC